MSHGMRCRFPNGTNCWVFGGVWEDMEHNWDDVTTACFDQLTTVEGRRKLREMWMKWKGLAA